MSLNCRSSGCSEGSCECVRLNANNGAWAKGRLVKVAEPAASGDRLVWPSAFVMAA